MTEARTAVQASARSVVVAVLLITLAAFIFSLLHALVRYLTAEIHPFEAAFLRYAFGLIFLLPWLIRGGATGLRTTRMGAHMLRAAATVAGTLIWFTAITVLPLAQAVALNFTVPLFATIGAAIFLGETVRARRWIATLIGFGGVIVIMRPGIAETTWTMFLPIAAALAIGLGFRQSVSESTHGTYLFLLHRPKSRLELIGTKLLTGTLVFLASMAAPLLIYAFWAATPGTHASPFEWSMTVPAWKAWYAFTIFYLAAFLSGIRPARWYGSRLFPLLALAPAALPLALFPGWRWAEPGVVVLIDAIVIYAILYVAQERDYS